ncbi:hypothetical protein R50073_37940 [Maricurvus nonylphenolicus]|uniref:transferrin-binding protein-like solute binding protein n=1 Tax=Maricurvus nonylphenolicus TaxID=1008307 RepID=UPI0036F2EA63
MMKNLNKAFAVSALSLAVSGAYANEQCDSLNDVRSFSFWDSPVLLTTCVLGNEPPASGPTNERPTIDSRELGRHDSTSFDPEVEVEVETPTEPKVALHIALPDFEDGDYIAYARLQGNHIDGHVDFINEDNSYENDLEGSTVAAMKINLNEGEGILEEPPVVPFALPVMALNGDTIGMDINSPDFEATSVVMGEYVEPEEGFVVYETYARVDSEGDNILFDGDIEQDRWTTTGDDPIVEKGSYTDAEIVMGWGNTDSVEVEADAGSEELLIHYINGWVGIYADSYQYTEGSNPEVEAVTYNRFVGSGFIYGAQVTPLQDIQNLIASDISLQYHGRSYNQGYGVTVDVNFGDKTFTGDFQHKDADESFTTVGVLQERHLISTSVSADSGFVQATFVGEKAAGMAGVLDVTQNAQRTTDSFYATRGEFAPE